MTQKVLSLSISAIKYIKIPKLAQKLQIAREKVSLILDQIGPNRTSAIPTYRVDPQDYLKRLSI